MNLNGKYIRLDLFHFTGKTYDYEVRAIQDEALLGHIKWFARWRCYCFFPETDTIFEKTCLRDITYAIEQLMLERKVKTSENY